MRHTAKTLLAALCGTALLATPALADITFSFDEGAPKDRFTITNSGDCRIENAVVTLDLSTSQSGLIFDVSGDGAGVEVFQPFEITTGEDALRELPSVKDGDNRVELDVVELPATKSISFTIDVDDTMGGREITVAGSEIEGARVTVSHSGTDQVAFFGTDARGIITLDTCS